jgi:hypothetical protein
MVSAQAIAITPSQAVSEAQPLVSQAVRTTDATVAAVLDQNWDRLFNENGTGDRNRDRFGHRDGNGFRDVNGDRYWIRDLHRDLYGIRYRLLDGVRNWLLYRHGVRLGNVNRVGPVYWNCYRDFYRDGDLLFNCYWIRLWHRDRNFLRDCDGLHVTLTVSESPAVAQTLAGT